MNEIVEKAEIRARVDRAAVPKDHTIKLELRELGAEAIIVGGVLWEA
jgi:hypothetical protein